MLERTNRAPGEAILRFLDGDVEVMTPGDFVLCAVTGQRIPLQALRYWSVDRQEAYRDAATAAERMGYE